MNAVFAEAAAFALVIGGAVYVPDCVRVVTVNFGLLAAVPFSLEARLSCAVPDAARMITPKLEAGLATHDWTSATPVELRVTVTNPVFDAVKVPMGVGPEAVP